MIYLIGGAPRIGKSTIARYLAKRVGARLISTDDIEINGAVEDLIFYNDVNKNIATNTERIDLVRDESKYIFREVKQIVQKSIMDKESVVIEGVHLLPEYISMLTSMFGRDNIISILVVSTNFTLVLDGVVHNTNQDNWLKNFSKDVLEQVTSFTVDFSKYLKERISLYHLTYEERTDNFHCDIDNVISKILSKSEIKK